MGMRGRSEHARGVALFHHLAGIEHIDTVGKAADEVEIVADEGDGHAKRLLEILQQIDDLGLHRDIQRGCRLIRDQQRGAIGNGHGDHDALALATRQFMGIRGHAAGGIGNPYQIQQAQRLGAGRAPAHPAVAHQRQFHLPANGKERIERGHRLLEHHADALAAHPVQITRGKRQQIAPLEQHLTGRLAIGRQQAEGGIHDLAFARAGLPDNGHGLAGMNLQIDAAHRLHRPGGGAETNPQSTDGHQRFHAQRSRGSRASRKPSPMKLSASNSRISMPAGNSNR